MLNINLHLGIPIHKDKIEDEDPRWKMEAQSGRVGSKVNQTVQVKGIVISIK
jgi:hypothetical protein